VRYQVLVLLSGIVPSRGYSAIGVHQSVSGLGGLTIATTCPMGPGSGMIGLVRALGLASGNGARPLSLDGVPSMSTEQPSSGQPPTSVLGCTHRDG
jgi:hypothetical protein